MGVLHRYHQGRAAHTLPCIDTRPRRQQRTDCATIAALGRPEKRSPAASCTDCVDVGTIRPRREQQGDEVRCVCAERRGEKGCDCTRPCTCCQNNGSDSIAAAEDSELKDVRNFLRSRVQLGECRLRLGHRILRGCELERVQWRGRRHRAAGRC
eukprot:scaffold79771_cov28-Tisochrysis_lutea.AAC.7